MSRDSTAAVVLAAGEGTRFKSELAKVLHPAAGRTLLGHVLEALRPLELGQVVVVVGHQGADVRTEAEAADIPGLTTVVQEQQLGTGHATAQALTALDDTIEQVLVVPGDAPALTPGLLAGVSDAAAEGDGALVTAELDDPAGYGRIVRAADGSVARIVEHADASPEQRAIREINAGVYCLGRVALAGALEQVDADNAQGEQYLTDVVELLVAAGDRVAAHRGRPEEVLGVNDRAQLSRAAAILRGRHLEHLMTEAGVTVIDPATTYVDVGVQIGRDSVVHPGCRLRGATRVGEGVELGPRADLTDTVVHDGARVREAVCDGAEVGPGADVGPFTHLRPGTTLARGAKAGGFVEVKESSIGAGAKVPHLSYVGDAAIGDRSNFSAGAVTVNYDGRDKHRTVVEEDAFVGCDTMLVAPVTVGRGAFVAAGSTITDDVPADALAIARSRQTNKQGWARARREARGE